MPALMAFEMIKQNDLTAIAIVDENYRLLNSCAEEDLKRLLAPDADVKNLNMPISEFLERFVDKSEYTSSVPLLQLENDFASCLKKMVKFHSDRVFLVDENKEPTGIVTLKEVIRFAIVGKDQAKAKLRSSMSATESGAERMKLYSSPAGEGHSKETQAALQKLCCSKITSPSNILTPAHMRNIWMNLPSKVRHHDWRMLFSTDNDGYTLTNLYRCCGRTAEPCVMVIKDQNERVFGCYTTEIWKHGGTSMYGSGQCFVFTFQVGWADNIEAYPWSERNDSFMASDHHTLSIGASGKGMGGGPAIRIDAGLLNGTSHPCQTFNSACLCGEDSGEMFKVASLEIWGLGWRKLKELPPIDKTPVC